MSIITTRIEGVHAQLVHYQRMHVVTKVSKIHICVGNALETTCRGSLVVYKLCTPSIYILQCIIMQ